jgi:preprotein translocase subunit SecD
MNRRTFLVTSAFVIAQTTAFGGDPTPPQKKLPDGIYAVVRDSDGEKGVLPLKDGEVLAVDRYRFQKADSRDPPRYLVVHTAPEVTLDLAAEPKAEQDGEEVVRVLLKLQPKSAAALAKLTGDRHYKLVTIILDGEVVTTHKIRATIANGNVQITSCSPGGAAYSAQAAASSSKG